MDPEMLSRIKFAMTAGFHFIFPPITIGLAWLLVWMFGRFNKTGDVIYGRMARWWLKIFTVTFVVGVATGITLEFQFGTNWADYSRYVGDIFGAPLAAEGVFAFFLESTFLGALVFGGRRLSHRAQWFAALMVAIGATLSAFWIIVANSWMQTPAGYQIITETVDGLVRTRAVLDNFWDAVFNPSTLPRYFHTIAAAFVTGGMFALGISAACLRKGVHVNESRRVIRAALIMTLLGSLAVAGSGHWHAVQITEKQPAKLAAMEGLYETEKGAPAMVFGIVDEDARTVDHAIRIPKLLSMMATFDPEAEIRGLNDLKDDPKHGNPPVALTFYSFHVMVILGTYFIGLSVVGLWLLRRHRLYTTRWYLLLAMLSLPLPILVNELGWIVAEVGRQPWIVYGELKTSQAFSRAVTGGEVLLDILVLSAIYAALLGSWIFVVRRILHHGPPALQEEQA